MNHDDLINRINQGSPQCDPWQEYKDYESDKAWRDRDKRLGHKRFEVVVSVKSILRAFKWISSRVKKWNGQK